MLCPMPVVYGLVTPEVQPITAPTTGIDIPTRRSYPIVNATAMQMGANGIMASSMAGKAPRHAKNVVRTINTHSLFLEPKARMDAAIAPPIAPVCSNTLTAPPIIRIIVISMMAFWSPKGMARKRSMKLT